LLNAWNPYYLVFNTPTWSLSAIMCYYLLFPLMAARVQKIKSPMLALWILAALFALPGLAADLLHSNSLFIDGLLHRNPVIRLPLFVSGMVLCMLYSRSAQAALRLRQVAMLAGIILLTVLGGTYMRFHESQLHIIRNGFYFPASLALVWLCVWAGSEARPAVQYWGKRLANASLPIFFLHVPLFDIFTKVEKIAVALYLDPGADLRTLPAKAQAVEQALPFYPLYIIPLIVICILVQERFVIPVQARIKQLYKEKTDARSGRERSLPAKTEGKAGIDTQVPVAACEVTATERQTTPAA
jgi:surface polysaccharide O-acyltransferase-like enzyme